jgi:hypothetical protein
MPYRCPLRKFPSIVLLCSRLNRIPSHWRTSLKSSLWLSSAGQCEFCAASCRDPYAVCTTGSGYSDKDVILPTIIDLARSKLICHNTISVRHTDLYPPARTAVLDVLLNLDLSPDASQHIFERLSKLLATLRTAFSVANDRKYLRSGYPSDPILEAVARQCLSPVPTPM